MAQDNATNVSIGSLLKSCLVRGAALITSCYSSNDPRLRVSPGLVGGIHADMDLTYLFVYPNGCTLSRGTKRAQVRGKQSGSSSPPYHCNQIARPGLSVSSCSPR